MSPPGKNVLKMSALTIDYHLTGHHEGGILIGGKGTQEPYNHSCSHLPKIADSKVIEVGYQQPNWCPHNLTSQKAPTIPVKADIEGNQMPHENQFIHL